MATVNRNRFSRIPNNRSKTDFSKVGGLTNHLKLLREIIILPLLYGELYTHFNIKAPKGVIFYGPPGTGKTLVAGALANELNKEGNGKVSFFQRKGADILDKWFGESERKLRELFDKASRSKPSVIFFDELDGLAPERSMKNDQVHCSVVATLLALMDGLDNMAGVIVIGATNRIDTIDPALRRPGRFDRELYFPLPCMNARREILQVHTRTWETKPTKEFLSHLSELTSGCCGSDLQALCSEAVLCCLKRKYPKINQKPKLNIDAKNIKVEEQDFLTARLNIVPTSQRLGNCKMRKLSSFVKPLLQRQVERIMRYIQVLLPHFTQTHKKYIIGSDRYAGRLVLKGTIQQGLNAHVVPALLQCLEHIPYYVLDLPTQFEKTILSAQQNLPSILVLSRIDDWWELLDTNSQMIMLTMMDDLHGGLPILLIATCSGDLPLMLQDYFHHNSSIVIQLDDPTKEEREQFFAPLFFGSTGPISVYKIWQTHKLCKIKSEHNEDDYQQLEHRQILTAKKRSASKRQLKNELNNISSQISQRVLKDASHRLRGGGGGGMRRKSSETSITLGQKRKFRKIEKRNRLRERARGFGRQCQKERNIKNNDSGTNGTHAKNSSLAVLQECCKTAFNYARQKFGVANLDDDINNNNNEMGQATEPAQHRSKHSIFTAPPHHHISQPLQTHRVQEMHHPVHAGGEIHIPLVVTDPHHRYSRAITDLVNCNNIMNIPEICPNGNFLGVKTLYMNDNQLSLNSIKTEPESNTSIVCCNQMPVYIYDDFMALRFAESQDVNLANIYSLWQRVSEITSDNLPVGQLELLYDTIVACIYINKQSFEEVMGGLEKTLENFELTCTKG